MRNLLFIRRQSQTKSNGNARTLSPQIRWILSKLKSDRSPRFSWGPPPTCLKRIL